ncbi:MAG: hypothetical protein M0R17_10105 [Candidatus Omnitrophica bacterium]|jgi:hypothetical protein|nr:hypothetical protein [Candidatus Omnitrophota bacterium]
MSDLRTASAIDVPQVIDAKPAFSNFSFIESLFGNLDSIRRIFSQVRFLGYKTLIVEHIDSVGFSKEDDLDLQSEGISIVLDPLVRVSFFRNEFKNIADITSQDNSSFLGYAILKKIPPDGHWIVFESVIISPRHDNNYLHKLRKYNVNVGGKLFNVKGILYCQQNSLTNVCAHAALRTCISIITPPADFSYSLMNKILRDGGKPHVLKQGLSIEQIVLILENLNIKYSLQVFPRKLSQDSSDKTQVNEIPYQSFLYSSIESGYPALLGFSLEELGAHIIPVFGHTFNQDTWVPKAKTSYFEVGKDTRYVPSETWVSTYICHDDNFGSYYCLPRNYLTNENEITVIALRPFNAEFDAILAEAIAADYLYTLKPIIHKEGETNEWAKRLDGAINQKGGWFVLRTLCMSVEEYIEHLRLLKGWGNETIPTKLLSALSAGLPKLLWVAEVSLPELFPANKRKLGEIVLDAGKVATPKPDLANFVLARILNKVYCFERSKENIGLVEYDAEIKTHTDLFSTQILN